jgi:dipeptidyl-peptidase-4
MRPRAVVWLAPLCFLCTAPAFPAAAVKAATERLTVSAILQREPLLGRYPSKIVWAPDGRHFAYTRRGNDPAEVTALLVHDAATGADAVAVPAGSLGAKAAPIGKVAWSPDSASFAFADAGALYLARGGHVTRVAKGATDPQYSPDGAAIAFVRDGDLYVARRIDGWHAVRVTKGAGPGLTHGDLDWVYMEELGIEHGFAWSPDSKRIAFLTIDDRRVTDFPIVDFLKITGAVEHERYPFAGGPNPKVCVEVVEPGSGSVRTLYDAGARDEYIARLAWTPSAGEVTALRINRAQTRADLLALDVKTDAARTLAVERDERFVDEYDVRDPIWLRDGRRFIWMSERDGAMGAYLVDSQTRRARRLGGRERIFEITGVDESAGTVFVTAAWPTRRDTNLLAVPLGDGSMRPMTSGPGTHAIVMAKDGRRYIDVSSTRSVPPAYSIGETRDAGASRPWMRGRDLSSFALPQPEAVSVPSRFGPLDAYMTKPPDFDPTMRYPVVMYAYGGPAAPTTQNAWQWTYRLFDAVLAEHGFIVFTVDGPGSQIDRASAQRRLSGELGPLSLAGQLAGVDYLSSLTYVDPARIGIWGWSFGGYVTCYALTHAPEKFKVGVAVAPVTDWRFYDTIYSERYMGMPQSRKAAYERSSVLPAVGRLRGRLLVNHGTSDDNVHIANTIALAQRAIETERQIDLAVYPGKGHSIAGLAQRRSLFGRVFAYFVEHL